MPDPSILPPQTDPYSQAYAGFCDALFQHPAVAALVKPSNQIRFDGAREAEIKYEKQTADRPELRVDVQAVSGGHTTGCKRWESRITLLLRIDSGDQRVNRALLPLHYAVTKAIVNCRNGHDKIRNVDLPYVFAVDQTPEGFAQVQDYQETEGEQHWSSFMRIILTLAFDDVGNLP